MYKHQQFAYLLSGLGQVVEHFWFFAAINRLGGIWPHRYPGHQVAMVNRYHKYDAIWVDQPDVMVFRDLC